MALEVAAVVFEIGSRDFRVEAVAVELYGPTPNDEFPLIDPPSGGTSIYPFAAQPTNWRGDD
jgi:hypothetical protein